MSSSKQPDSSTLNPFDEFDDEEDIELSDAASTDTTEEVLRSNQDSFQRAQTVQLKKHCIAIDDIIQAKALNPFALEELGENLTNMQKILSKDKPESQGQVGPCLKYLLHENVIENIYMFSTRQREYAKEVRIFLLKFFTEVFARSLQPILIHQQILRPVSKLLRACEGTEDSELTSSLVPLLHQICILMQENQSLLDLFFIESKVHMQSRFLVLTALIPHMHEMGDVGNRARDALLLCLSLADQLPGTHLSRFIATDCNFCQVLATGLSGLYSELPTSRVISLDDWQSPLHVIEEAVPELTRFTQTLGFCNSVLQMAPTVVCETVLSLVREGFLNQVMGAALLQSSTDAVTFATTYLTVFLTHISDVALMREFLKFVTLSKHDGRPILSSLMQNISSSNHKLCAVTLELFYVLLSVNCEDVLLELVLRYLIPGHHVMPNQLAIIGSPDLYSQAARRFLQLIPAACLNAEKMFLESIHQLVTPPQTQPEEAGTHPPIFTSSPIQGQTTLKHPTPVHAPAASGTVPGKPLTNMNPFDLPVPAQRGTRSRSGSDASTSSLVSISSTSSAQLTGNTSLNTGGNTSLTGFTAFKTIVPFSGADEEQKSIGVGKYSSPKSNGPSFHFDYITPEMAYFKNLIAAKEAIQECASRCRCWSSSYDKCIVSKEALAETANDEQTRIKSLEMEDVPVRVRITSDGDENESKDNADNFDFGRFRSRATTASAHSRVSRTNSARVQSRRALVAPRGDEDNNTSAKATEHAQNDANGHLGLSSSPLGVRRRATVKDRSSPRLARKLAGSKFEDKVGLFLKIVVEKLSDMLQLPPAVNVLLTRLISRLAQFPQPLLRSLLLNHHLVLRPGIPNLIYVLQTIKTTIDSYSRTQEGFEKRLGRARKTMIYRAQVRNSQIEPSAARQMVNRLLRQSSRIDMGLEHALSDVGPSPLRKRTSKTSLATSESQADDIAPISRSRARTDGASLKSSVRVKKKKVSTDTLFAIVIFDEFLRELAALSQEHSVLNPLTYSPKTLE